MSVCMSGCVYMSVYVWCSLTPEGKMLLMQFGSSLVGRIKFRDNFVMIGQKGLAQGSAIEQVLAVHHLSQSLASLCVEQVVGQEV